MDKVIKYCEEDNIEALKKISFSLLQTYDKKYPLDAALRKNSILVVKYILSDAFPEDEIREAVNNRTLDSKCFPIHLASQNCNQNTEIIDILIRYGADINIQEGKHGKTPLHIAASKDNFRCVECLLKYKDINIFINNDSGFPPVFSAKGNSRSHQLISEASRLKRPPKILPESILTDMAKYSPKPPVPLENRENNDNYLYDSSE
jgi:ankyrin repeat protein